MIYWVSTQNSYQRPNRFTIKNLLVSGLVKTDNIHLCLMFCRQRQLLELWNILKILLTLSHGQAAIEHGFAVNKEVLTSNVKEVNMMAIKYCWVQVW